MDLNVYCRNCKSSFKVHAKSINRPELVSEIGEYFERTCSKCKKRSEFHVNQVKAEESMFVNIVGSAIGLGVIGMGTLFFWNQGIITNVFMIVGALILTGSNSNLATSNANAFNKYKIRPSSK